jgi:predicted dehydrogenase
VIEAEAQSGKRVMPIFQYRFGHGIQKLRQLIQEGLTGRAYLSTVETSWRRRAAYYDIPWRGKWKTELGGAIVGHAIHNHDLLNYAMGPIKSVFARVSTLVNQIEVEDTAVIAAEMADGSLATLALTLGSPAEISRMRFSFANLSAESSTKPYSCGADPWIFTPDTPEAATLIEESLARFEPLPEGFPGQLYRFYHALKTGTELPVTVQDARRSMELISAIYYSDRTGRPVELPLGADHPTYQGWMPDNMV